MIFVDEAPTNTHANAFEMLHRACADIMGTSAEFGPPFGGLTVVVGGDFRQTLPVVRSGQAADALAASPRRWHHFDQFRVLRLHENVRVPSGTSACTARARAYAVPHYDIIYVAVHVCAHRPGHAML